MAGTHGRDTWLGKAGDRVTCVVGCFARLPSFVFILAVAESIFPDSISGFVNRTLLWCSCLLISHFLFVLPVYEYFLHLLNWTMEKICFVCVTFMSLHELDMYRIPPYFGACTYIRNPPIFRGEKSASYISAPLLVSYRSEIFRSLQWHALI